MDQFHTFKADGNDRESGLASTIEFDDRDAADAIGLAARRFGPGQFLLSRDGGGNWRIHVANDHSWWLEPVARL